MLALDKIELGGKTKEAAAVLKALKMDKRALIVTEGNNEPVVRAFRNIPYVTVLPAEQINVKELVAYAKCIMTVPAIKIIEEAYRA